MVTALTNVINSGGAVLARRDKNGWVTGLDEGGHRGHGVVVPSDDPGELLVR